MFQFYHMYNAIAYDVKTTIIIDFGTKLISTKLA